MPTNTTIGVAEIMAGEHYKNSAFFFKKHDFLAFFAIPSIFRGSGGKIFYFSENLLILWDYFSRSGPPSPSFTLLHPKNGLQRCEIRHFCQKKRFFSSILANLAHFRGSGEKSRYCFKKFIQFCLYSLYIIFSLTALLPPLIRLPKFFIVNFQKQDFSKSQKTRFRPQAPQKHVPTTFTME